MIDFKDEQKLKAFLLIVVTEEGITMLINELHPENPFCPIYVAVDGMFTSVNDMQL